MTCAPWDSAKQFSKSLLLKPCKWLANALVEQSDLHPRSETKLKTLTCSSTWSCEQGDWAVGRGQCIFVPSISHQGRRPSIASQAREPLQTEPRSRVFFSALIAHCADCPPRRACTVKGTKKASDVLTHRENKFTWQHNVMNSEIMFAQVVHLQIQRGDAMPMLWAIGFILLNKNTPPRVLIEPLLPLCPCTHLAWCLGTSF